MSNVPAILNNYLHYWLSLKPIYKLSVDVVICEENLRQSEMNSHCLSDTYHFYVPKSHIKHHRLSFIESLNFGNSFKIFPLCKFIFKKSKDIFSIIKHSWLIVGMQMTSSNSSSDDKKSSSEEIPSKKTLEEYIYYLHYLDI